MASPQQSSFLITNLDSNGTMITTENTIARLPALSAVALIMIIITRRLFGSAIDANVLLSWITSCLRICSDGFCQCGLHR